MKKAFFLSLLITILLCSSISAQHLGAYIDYMERFYIFDKGKSTQVEHLMPQDFKIGGECVLYSSNQGHLKMYYNGEVETLEKVKVSEYYATDHLAVYSIYEKLKVVYKGEVIELGNRVTNYDVGDSVVAFYDKNRESLNVFYKGEINEIESGLIGFPVLKWDSGDNIIAYISERNKDFKIWYNGEVHHIERNVAKTKFKVGRDIVAYIDELEQNFKAFYKGEVYTIEDFMPTSFQVADEFVAYVDHMGEFKIFTKGETELVSTITPDGYLAEDNVLAFIVDNFFKAWYEGEVIEIEGYRPSVYKIDWNTIAYLDNSNRIFIYSKGERKYLSNELVTQFDIHRDLIQMKVKVDRNIIYYNDTFYEGEKSFK